MTDIYTIRQVAKENFEIANKDDVYTVKVRNKIYTCDCFGFRRQHDKSQHKHCKMVRFWIDNLDKEPGFAFWWENEDLEYNKFIDISYLSKYL